MNEAEKITCTKHFRKKTPEKNTNEKRPRWLKDITKAGEYVDDLSKLRKEMEALAEKAKSTPQMINITYLGSGRLLAFKKKE